MGYYIDTHCQGVQGINEIYAAALNKIKLGAITIGEMHIKPYARAVVHDLITAGFVKRLFIESFEPNADFSKTLRNSEANLGKEPKQWPDSDGKGTFEFAMDFLDRERPNELPLKSLVQRAVSKSVKIYFYDMYHEQSASNAGMQARNEAMGKVFLKHTEPTETKTKSPIGAVALVGGKHLEIPANQEIYTLSLQAACKIPHDHVFDFHRV